MYKYQAALVSRTGLVLFFIFFFTAGFSQEHADSISLLKDSEILLAKKINFSWKGGKLTEVFDQLGADYGLKFAYSEDKIENISIGTKKFSGTPVVDVLESLLKNSGFTYLIIGKTIAIVKDNQTQEKNGSPTPEIKTGRVTQEKESHIYPTSSLTNKLSSKEDKLLRKIYGKELRWKARHRTELTAMDSSTIEKERRPNSAIPLVKGKSWYVRANLGLDNYFLRYRNVSSLNWKEELGFTSNPKRSLLAEAEVGLFYKRFILATGIGIHKLSLENTYTDTKAPPPPPGPAPPPDPKEKIITENYSILTMPLHLLMYKQHRNVYFAGGGGIRTSFIKKTSGKGSLKEYYNQYVKTDKFSEKKFVTSFGVSFRVEAGFKATQHILVGGGLESTVSISPYIKNSLYKFYPHSLSFKLSILYFLH